MRTRGRTKPGRLTSPNTPASDADRVLVRAAVAQGGGRWGAWAEPGIRAQTLEALARGLNAVRAKVIITAARETALTADELQPEFDRMTGTLRLLARVVREGSWVEPRVDPKASLKGAAPIGPDHDVRSMLIPVGPVAVFGASNFPLAYGVLGGDTASALAAGCAVVVKEHPAHPKTGRLLHAVARRAMIHAGVDPHVLGYVRHEDPGDFHVAERIVQSPVIRAVGFTGSPGGGAGVEALARARAGGPIAVFAEMGSVNPVRITPAAMAARGPRIADLLADSLLLRHGQQCTKPGIVFVQPGPGSAEFVARLSARVASASPRDMLAPWIKDGFVRAVDKVRRVRGVRVLAKGRLGAGPRSAGAILLGLRWGGGQPRVVLDELFGPGAIVVELTEFDDPFRPYPPSLTWTLFAEPGEPPTQGSWGGWGPADEIDAMARVAGRVVVNGPPTGVRVCGAMVHGGPWPATNRADSTAVGPLALTRWCRRVCWQNSPREWLPARLAR